MKNNYSNLLQLIFSPECKKFAAGSEKAQQQIELEQRFAAFENKF